MKSSPVQLLQLVYKKLSVEYDAAHASGNVLNPFTDVFSFDGIVLNTEVGFGAADLNHELGKLYVVSLRLLIPNTRVETEPAQKFSPYKIDVEAEAIILIRNGAEQIGTAEDLAKVNGASLIWSSIREQVLNMSSRMSAGPVMLPTVHFQDMRTHANGSEIKAKKQAVKKPAAKRIR